ncbi:Kinesin motor domain [Phytophthora infestans]|uniref:Kinesin motor domain n=1 Tax=Phytophthora infestans TaxID=4787 RepID=A0A833WDF8_PHYIN|nr:Kinesin motor domain [Phytophthora infestans]
MEELTVQIFSSGKSPANSPKRHPPPPLSARVKVAVRVRPPVANNENEPASLCISETEPANTGNVVQFKLEKTQKSFRFDHVFSAEATQADVYTAALQPLLVSLMHGFNVTVLAYGQTGSGKTYTMGGVEVPTVESDNDDGLILRFLRDLFTALRTEVSVRTIKISFLEIYCDEIRDLLGERARSSSQHGGRQASGAKLTIHEDDQDVWVEGLQQVEVKSVNEALDLLRTGRQRQTVGAHALNDQSSRSHAVYTRTGSERAKKTLQEGHGMKEGSRINIGLLALGNVINALGSRQRSLQLLNSPRVSSRGTGSGNVTPRHVPYRSSKLTRLLRDALGGNSVTLFIACVSPEITNGNETLNTLQYANRARSIQNKAQKNVEGAEDVIVDAASGTETEREIYALREQVAALKLQLDQALAAAKAAECRESSRADANNHDIPTPRESPNSSRRLRIVPLELDLPDYTDRMTSSCSLQRKRGLLQNQGFYLKSSISNSTRSNEVTTEEQSSMVPELLTPPKVPILEVFKCSENATIHSISEKYSPRLSSKREDGSLSRRVMIDQATQYEPLCPQHERKTLIDYVLLSPSEIFREVHNQKKLEGAPSPWPHRRRQDNESSVSKAKSQSRSKTRDVLHDLLQCTRQLVENSPVFGDFDRNPEVQDPSRKEEQSPLSFDTFVNRMTALYDQRSRQHQFVHRLQQRFRHLASLLAVANADNQVNELSKYTLDHQFDQLQQQLSRFERLAADRLWTRLQNREVAIENYTAVWNDQMAEVFLSDDQYEACRPWHPHREDHGFFQHRILPFILSGWISVTPSDLDNEQLWLAL